MNPEYKSLERTPEQICLSGWFMGEAPHIPSDCETWLMVVRTYIAVTQDFTDSKHGLA
jgi:hypothetical protein